MVLTGNEVFTTHPGLSLIWSLSSGGKKPKRAQILRSTISTSAECVLFV